MMAILATSSSSLIAFMILMSSELILQTSASNLTCDPIYPLKKVPDSATDKNLLQFAENLEFLEAEFFLWGALGYGLDKVAPELAMDGHSPIGAQKANLDNLTENIIEMFGYQEVGHLRALKETVGLIQMPQLNLNAANFAYMFDEAFGYRLDPPFNPYVGSLHYMLASYVIPYVGLVGYVGTNPYLQGSKSRELLAGLLGVESGQDAVIRTYLYERAEEKVAPYNTTVAEFTTRISELRNRLAGCGIKDKGIIVPPQLGADNRTETNVLSANSYSLSYSRTPAEILRIVYGTGNESKPGGFYPEGGNGEIARGYLNN